MSQVMRVIQLRPPKSSTAWRAVRKLLDQEVYSLKPKELCKVASAFAAHRESAPTPLLLRTQSELPSFSHADFARVLLACGAQGDDADALRNLFHAASRMLPQRWAHLSDSQVSIVLEALAQAGCGYDDAVIEKAAHMLRTRHKVDSTFVSSVHSLAKLDWRPLTDDEHLLSRLEVCFDGSWDDVAQCALIYAYVGEAPANFIRSIEQRLQKEVIHLDVYERLLDAFVRLRLNLNPLVPHAIHLEPRIHGPLRVLTLRIDGVEEVFLPKCCQDMSLRPKALRQLVVECMRIFETDAWSIETKAPPDYLLEALRHLRNTLVSRRGAFSVDEKKEIRLRLKPLKQWIKLPF